MTQITPELVAEKQALRQAMREKLRAQTALQMAESSRRIVARLHVMANDIQIGRGAIALFLAQSREPNLDEFARELLEKGERVFAPRTGEGENFFAEIAPDWSNIAVNERGWREPRDCYREYSQSESRAAPKLQTVMLPALAFDYSGQRLGQGGGWYDRALEALPAGVLRVGVAFDFQIVENVPHEAHDQRVGLIVTERRIIRI
jgi:5-formyltetrahydrofolate cyclo-ligase